LLQKLPLVEEDLETGDLAVIGYTANMYNTSGVPRLSLNIQWAIVIG
jgi:hypothetical protein